MGGAGTAAGNDSAMPYLNPSGMAGVPNDIFAVSATIYAYSWRNVDRFFAPNGFPEVRGAWSMDRQELSTSTFFELPSSVMYFRKLTPEGSKSRVLLGGSLVIPSTERTELVGGFDVRFPTVGASQKDAVAVSRQRTDYYAGPTLAASLLEDKLRLGLSGYLLYSRSFSSFQSSSFFTFANGSQISDLNTQFSRTRRALSLAPIAGVQANLFSRVWVGLAVAAPTVHLSGSAEGESSAGFSGIDPGTGTPTSTRASTSRQGDFRATRPLRLNAGLAWDDPGRLAVAVDVHYYAARSDALIEEGERRESSFQTGQVARNITDRYRESSGYQSVIDLSLGVEFGLSKLLALRLGGFTDQGSTGEPATPVASDFYSIRENNTGGTAGVGFRFGSFDSTFGLVYTRHKGRLITFDSQLKASPESVETSAHSLVFLLSGAVTKEEARKTIQETLPEDAPVLQKVLP